MVILINNQLEQGCIIYNIIKQEVSEPAFCELCEGGYLREESN